MLTLNSHLNLCCYLDQRKRLVIRYNSAPNVHEKYTDVIPLNVDPDQKCRDRSREYIHPTAAKGYPDGALDDDLWELWSMSIPQESIMAVKMSRPTLCRRYLGFGGKSFVLTPYS